MSRLPIDTTDFMSRYFHPKNISGGFLANTSTHYSIKHGLYRQKQIDDEINRIRANKKPSSSKISITISPSNLLSMYHHHHHCLDIQLTSRTGKGRVVWFWDKWEKATDERVMKGVIAALDSSWNGQQQQQSGGEETSPPHSSKKKNIRNFFDRSNNSNSNSKKSNDDDAIVLSDSEQKVDAGEKRKRAATAAESRMSETSITPSSSTTITAKRKKA